MSKLNYFTAQAIWMDVNHVQAFTRVKISRMPKLGESGWGGNTYNPAAKQGAVGGIGSISKIYTDTLAVNTMIPGLLHFPFFCLEVMSVQDDAK